MIGVPMSAPEPVDRLLTLLPELTAALRRTAPHRAAQAMLPGVTLTPRQMAAVMRLALHGPQSMSRLASGLGIGRAAASELVQSICEKGLAQRSRDAADGRRILVDLDPAAAGQAREVTRRLRADLLAALARHPSIRPDDLAAFLGDLIATLRPETSRPDPGPEPGPHPYPCTPTPGSRS